MAFQHLINGGGKNLAEKCLFQCLHIKTAEKTAKKKGEKGSKVPRA